MKKNLVIFSLIAMLSMVSFGCGSASSCWTRNGSRVPTQTSLAGTQVAPAPMMQDQVIYSSACNPCSAVSQACNPCSTSCNPCDPCGSSSQSNYAAPLPGMQQ